MESPGSYEISANVNKESCLLGSGAVSFRHLDKSSASPSSDIQTKQNISFIMLGITHPMTWYHILEDFESSTI